MAVTNGSNQVQALWSERASFEPDFDRTYAYEANISTSEVPYEFPAADMEDEEANQMVVDGLDHIAQTLRGSTGMVALKSTPKQDGKWAMRMYMCHQSLAFPHHDDPEPRHRYSNPMPGHDCSGSLTLSFARWHRMLTVKFRYKPHTPAPSKAIATAVPARIEELSQNPLEVVYLGPRLVS